MRTAYRTAARKGCFMNYLNKKTVEDIDVAGKRVLVRCDFNVPFDSEGNISDTKRIDSAMKTIKYLLNHAQGHSDRHRGLHHFRQVPA